MMVKWANDGEMLLNDGEMSELSYTQFTIIDEYFTINNKLLTIISLKGQCRYFDQGVQR